MHICFVILNHDQSVDPALDSERVVPPRGDGLSASAEDEDEAFVTPAEDGGRGDCSPDCGAPLKAVRPVRPALVPVRSVGIGSSSPSTSAAVLDDSHFAKWVIEFGGDALDEVLFSYSGRIARRVDLRSLAPGVVVTVAVINVWSCILNYRERSKAPSAPARVFASPLTTLNTAVGLQLNEVDSERVAWFAGSLGADFALTPYKQWSHVNLLFFPIVESKRFYLLCVNFETERLEIIDSSASTEATALKYGDTPDNVKLLLYEYFKKVREGFLSGVCLNLETKRMPMKWRDSRNTIDCGVYVMRHMESFFGESVGSWVCGLAKGDRAELNRLRLHYMKELCTFDVNVHRTSNVARALRFVSTSSTAT
nr:uncharacterized protein LOC109189836 [Ipomoea batatas]